MLSQLQELVMEFGCYMRAWASAGALLCNGFNCLAFAGGSAEGQAEAKEEGMWLALSQIQEWVVEFGCDMLFISFRTDVAWYRLSK